MLLHVMHRISSIWSSLGGGIWIYQGDWLICYAGGLCEMGGELGSPHVKEVLWCVRLCWVV